MFAKIDVETLVESVSCRLGRRDARDREEESNNEHEDLSR